MSKDATLKPMICVSICWILRAHGTSSFQTRLTPLTTPASHFRFDNTIPNELWRKPLLNRRTSSGRRLVDMKTRQNAANGQQSIPQRQHRKDFQLGLRLNGKNHRHVPDPRWAVRREHRLLRLREMSVTLEDARLSRFWKTCKPVWWHGVDFLLKTVHVWNDTKNQSHISTYRPVQSTWLKFNTYALDP